MLPVSDIIIGVWVCSSSPHIVLLAYLYTWLCYVVTLTLSTFSSLSSRCVVSVAIGVGALYLEHFLFLIYLFQVFRTVAARARRQQYMTRGLVGHGDGHRRYRAG